MGWRWVSASETGTSHQRLGMRKQDAMACFEARPGAVCAIVCDGAGSAQYGGEGASLICRTLTEALRQHFRNHATLPNDAAIWCWIEGVRERLDLAAKQRGKTRRAFAATLVLLVATESEIMTVHVGDGAIVGRDGKGDWWTLSAPAHGEYAATTWFVTDSPAPQLRVSRYTDNFTGFALFSDGVEHLTLDHRTNEPHVPFFRAMLAPIDKEDGAGKSETLSAALSGFLNGARVCERTDDDKTLLLIAAGS